MVTLAEFVTKLAESVVEMGRILSTDVALYDPLSTVSLVMGVLLILFSVGVLGYLTLGAVGDLLGVGSAR